MMNTPDRHPTALVIGFGERHLDEMIGAWLGDLLEEMNCPDVQEYSVSRLVPELVGRIAQVDYIIFVTTCKMPNSETIRVTSLAPVGSETAGSSVPGLGHSCDPASLLALTQSVHGHHPQAWFVEVAPFSGDSAIP
jgi:Ni,Fe-hydrogenase maturation factor